MCASMIERLNVTVVVEAFGTCIQACRTPLPASGGTKMPLSVREIVQIVTLAFVLCHLVADRYPTGLHYIASLVHPPQQTPIPTNFIAAAVSIFGPCRTLQDVRAKSGRGISS